VPFREVGSGARIRIPSRFARGTSGLGPSGHEMESENQGLGSSGWVSKGGFMMFDNLKPPVSSFDLFYINDKEIVS
jgi:hypothetical protein